MQANAVAAAVAVALLLQAAGIVGVRASGTAANAAAETGRNVLRVGRGRIVPNARAKSVSATTNLAWINSPATSVHAKNAPASAAMRFTPTPARRASTVHRNETNTMPRGRHVPPGQNIAVISRESTLGRPRPGRSHVRLLLPKLAPSV